MLTSPAALSAISIRTIIHETVATHKIDGPMNFISTVFELLVQWPTNKIADRWSQSLSKDYKNDPVYKQQLQDLIERNREFEKPDEPDSKFR